jgi:uridine kinase
MRREAMIGDKLNIKQFHIDAAADIAALLHQELSSAAGVRVLTVAGQSGAGKSEIAYALSEKLGEKGIKCAILQQDDYFVHPPKTNAAKRREDLGHVGMSEVKLSLIEKNLESILGGAASVEKPLVVYEDDRITSEVMDVTGVRVVIVEGTYVTALDNAHHRVFIDRTYLDTAAARLERAREEQDDHLEKVLKIEHGIISKHKERADIIVTRDYKVEMGGVVDG